MNRHFARISFLLLALFPIGSVCAQEEEDLDPYRPGLMAQYTGVDGQTHSRLDGAVNFVWRETLPDRRLPSGKFQARWRGRLLSVEPGPYRLHLYATGKVELTLKGQRLIEGLSAEPHWHTAPPVELTYGYHELEINYQSTTTSPRLSLFWEGPKFQLEPLPDRQLYHDPKVAPRDTFAEGERLTRALRCKACHDIAGEEQPLPAPALTRLAGNLDPQWLAEWLVDSGNVSKAGDATSESLDQVARRMPHLAISPADATAIAAYMIAESEPTPRIKEPSDPPKEVEKQADKKDKNAKKNEAEEKERKRLSPAEEGSRLFATTGCLACHRVGELGAEPLFGGGDLTGVGSKRPADFFARWLVDPASVNPAHRMPVFTLSKQERSDLAAYLATQHKAATVGRAGGGSEPVAAKPASGSGKPASSKLERGKQLLAEHRCGNCHALPKKTPQAATPIVSLLTKSSDWSRSCLSAVETQRRRPRYQVSKDQATAIQNFISTLQSTRAHDGLFVLHERNCIGCHARDAASGIAPHLTKVIERWPELTPELPALAPPALFGVGDKLHEAALVAAIGVKHPPRRPWLGIRMPRFDLHKEEMAALVTHLVDADRIPPQPPLPQVNVASPSSEVLRIAGTRLVTADGFGCTSCHQIGETVPQKVALNARGTDLSLLGTRIRHEWYERWVRNPGRIVPRMEMPSIVVPVRGVLHDMLNDQLASVWQVLNQPGFNPPLPNPVRVVRASNLPEQKEAANILTDVLEDGKTVYSRPLIVGLPNRHNVLFDLESNRLAGWWIGDTARQRTRGKSWYWEQGGDNIWPIREEKSDLRLSLDGKPGIEPIDSGQFATEFDSLRHVPGGVEFQHRLRFEPKGQSAVDLTVVQTITPIWASGGTSTGFRRRVEARRLPKGANLDLHMGIGPGVTLVPSGTSGLTVSKVHVVAVDSASRYKLDPEDKSLVLVLANPGAERPAFCELEYSTQLPTDQYVSTAPVLPPPTIARLNVVPGYEVVRLPLPEEEMPTALAWREDGTLVVCSLKGRVLLARDTDGDGLEDEIKPFSDELAAPYGVQAHDGVIDVICKYGLLRLHDDNRDGRAERTEVLVSGWGYTPDYHDWVVGLERDEQGNYYVALPCQQDNRSEPAANLRGQGLKLVPRKPTADNPHSYSIESFCGGLRFPMGLARNRAGHLFASDNQGNYNPFNELNHLLPGKRYGFINKLEFKPDFKPPLESPAIEIPHPWTRSVNGICFLETPPEVRTKLGRDLFGPFEGHLIGCEYDTRRLVRISLQPFGDTFQGAIYPFTAENGSDEPLQGPITCRVSPAGDLYIGNLRDSGWGGDRNVGSIARLRPSGELPPGIAEVRATPTGFVIDFTQPLDRQRAVRAENYAVSLYRRVSTSAYGGPDVDRQTAPVKQVEISADGRRATLQLDKLRPGFVYELHLSDMVPTGERFHPAEAHFTLRGVPRE